MTTYIVALIAFGVLITIALPLIVLDIKGAVKDKDILSLVFYGSLLIFVVAYLLN